jgi:hypothetical protein
MNPNYTSVALESSRHEFAHHHRGFFLVGEPRIAAPSRNARATQLDATSGIDRPIGTAPVRIVCPVRKVQTEFRFMIAVGRTTDNDIVLWT